MILRFGIVAHRIIHLEFLLNFMISYVMILLCGEYVLILCSIIFMDTNDFTLRTSKSPTPDPLLGPVHMKL